MKLKPKKEPPTHYQVLGVSPSIEASFLHVHYRELALTYHPDKLVGRPEEEVLAAQERFARITEAYAVLRSPTARAAYDARLKLLGLECDACGGKGLIIKVSSFRIGAKGKTKVCERCKGTGRSPDR